MRTKSDRGDRHVLVDPATAPAALRERVYATITGLSTVAVLFGYAEETSAWTRQIARIAAQVLETALVPVLVIALAETGIWTVRTGLVLAAIVLVATQGLVAAWAVRRSTIGVGRRLMIIAVEIALGRLAIAIKKAAH